MPGRMTKVTEYKKIYLEPICKDCPYDPEWERTWCSESDVWEYDCDNCGKEMDVMEYVLKEKPCQAK